MPPIRSDFAILRTRLPNNSAFNFGQNARGTSGPGGLRERNKAGLAKLHDATHLMHHVVPSTRAYKVAVS
ncbi:hypothetical protein EmuJ_000883100 [Echinococcus multilocularis]|uniref:Uncharacterized protein n=1 Tax=Echinococcus multilocularis TaxID=6211 RepID=A0A068YFT3_ECHMU|nr:hypothetical protein EmuJ_000883100 [Echinococcus multilocularis]